MQNTVNLTATHDEMRKVKKAYCCVICEMQNRSTTPIEINVPASVMPHEGVKMGNKAVHTDSRDHAAHMPAEKRLFCHSCSCATEHVLKEVA